LRQVPVNKRTEPLPKLLGRSVQRRRRVFTVQKVLFIRKFLWGDENEKKISEKSRPSSFQVLCFYRDRGCCEDDYQK
jgi:hypothetical protein